ncbi:RagB/SusD family nutrient uptake outer membrane protein [Rufibacter roseus]|uniref:RagB/SusD family nutrient uptake outer membrane protein n=1 Tax=Rufibacter roseus TaxID=1567108 RepID=A0ABW2DL99_9BACT|nr:RagB/SusD family nutrient uptake outer membrane protein [Rufibacter roseus]
MLRKIIVLLFIGLISQSCKELDLAPWDRPSDLTFWQTKEDAVNAVTACYGDLYNAETYIFNESLSDNAYTKSNNGNLVRDIANGNYDASNPLLQQVWANRYAGIRRCNQVLANIDRVAELDPSLKERLRAEARFLRAFHYFVLVNHFGGVPLIENVITIDESRNVVRASRETIVNFIHQELDLAYQNLPVNTAYAETDIGRATKGAALALKARMYLYDSNWPKVVETTEILMNGTAAGTYSLFPSYAGLFKMSNENNQEVIFDVQFMPIRRTHRIQYFLIPPTEGGYAAISPSQELVDSYLTINGRVISENGSGWNENTPYQNRDPRLRATIVYDGYPWVRADGTTTTINTRPGSGANSIGYSSNTTPTGYYVAKYFDPTAQNLVNSGLNLILIRYADVLLMHAEAKNELGQFNQDVWNKTIRRLRERAGFTDPNALMFPSNLGQAGLRDIIRRERRVELAFEGLRYYDIKRWQIADEVLNGWLHGMKTNNSSEDNGYERVDLRRFDPAKHYLWPIPQSERDRTNNLEQNPNW